MRTMTFMAGELGLAVLAALVILGTPPSAAIADSLAYRPAMRSIMSVKLLLYVGVWPARNTRQGSNRQPTFLNLDEPYPNHVFTAVIWGRDRAAFPYAPESLADRRICVTGTIQVYRGKAEIMVSGPNQIKTTE